MATLDTEVTNLSQAAKQYGTLVQLTRPRKHRTR